MLGSFDAQSISLAKEMMLNKYGAFLEDEEIEDIENRVSMLLKNKTFLSLVKGECYKEKAIRYKNNLRYIDLLVKSNSVKESLFERWNIIDYKSALSYVDEHKKQVSYYVNAIKEITGDEVDGYICYLLQGSIKIVKI